MKKLIIALLVVGLLPVVALAQPPAGTEVDSWAYLPDATGVMEWVWQSSASSPNQQALARCFVSFPEEGKCNKDWEIPFKIHASVAQWIEWNFSGTRWDWFVRKPGNYAADCLTFVIKSNQAVTIDFHSFADLEAEDPKPDQDRFIEIFYCFDPPGGVPPLKTNPIWIPAADLNLDVNWFYIDDSPALHEGMQFKFWNYIHVEECNSACEYQNDAFVTLTLECQKDWIDTGTGFFLW